MTTGAVLPYDEPDQLRAGIEENLLTLGLDRLAAVNLRLMDGSRPGRPLRRAARCTCRGPRRRTDRRDRSEQHFERTPAQSCRPDARSSACRICSTSLINARSISWTTAPRKASHSYRSARWAGRAAFRTQSSRVPSSSTLVPAWVQLPRKSRSRGCSISHPMCSSSPARGRASIWPKTSARPACGSTTRAAWSWRGTFPSSRLFLPSSSSAQLKLSCARAVAVSTTRTVVWDRRGSRHFSGPLGLSVPEPLSTAPPAKSSALKQHWTVMRACTHGHGPKRAGSDVNCLTMAVSRRLEFSSDFPQHHFCPRSAGP